MARTLRWKVYDDAGQYMASCREIEGAAAIVAFYGYGATIREGSRVVWCEGHDGEAGDSYDAVAEFVYSNHASEVA